MQQVDVEKNGGTWWADSVPTAKPEGAQNGGAAPRALPVATCLTTRDPVPLTTLLSKCCVGRNVEK